MSVQFSGGLGPNFQPYSSAANNLPSNATGPGMPVTSILPGPNAAPAADAGAASAGLPNNNVGHVVQNPTNSISQANTMGGYDSSALSAMSVAQPMMLSPVMFQMGMPMMFALVAIPVMGLGSYTTGMPGQAPVSDIGAGNTGSTPPPPTQIEAPPITAPSATASSTESGDVDAADDALLSIPDVSNQQNPADSGPDIIDVVPLNAMNSVGNDATDNAANNGTKPTLLIESMQSDDFERYRQRSSTNSLETSLQLELRTLEGDLITLNFHQLDEVSKQSFRGESLDDGPVRLNREQESHERVVNMSVEGSLSEAEHEAIDSILAAMIDVAGEFVNGDMDNALAKLREMDFDTATLSDLSLQLSMTSNVESNRAYRRDADSLDRLANRDGEVKQVLEFIANEQKQLVESAQEILDPSSAVRLVKALMPPLLSEPMSELMQAVDANAGDSIADDSATLNLQTDEPQTV